MRSVWLHLVCRRPFTITVALSGREPNVWYRAALFIFIGCSVAGIIVFHPVVFIIVDIALYTIIFLVLVWLDFSCLSSPTSSRRRPRSTHSLAIALAFTSWIFVSLVSRTNRVFRTGTLARQPNILPHSRARGHAAKPYRSVVSLEACARTVTGTLPPRNTRSAQLQHSYQEQKNAQRRAASKFHRALHKWVLWLRPVSKRYRDKTRSAIIRLAIEGRLALSTVSNVQTSSPRKSR